ncbi:uncharacterized protein [Arachis hypogaea]|uniref:uncharacterized protein n=1 Tax=Arachis hypogaea TaxID=3818 RepID=UPI003B218BA3
MSHNSVRAREYRRNSLKRKRTQSHHRNAREVFDSSMPALSLNNYMENLVEVSQNVNQSSNLILSDQSEKYDPSINSFSQVGSVIDHPLFLQSEIQGCLDVGDPNYKCSICGACFWLSERVERDSTVNRPVFTVCCSKGKIHMFAFTSLGGKVLDSVNDGSGPPQFIITGQNYHQIRSLLPDSGQKPKFAQLYIYDTQHEIMHRQGIFRQISEIDKELITELLQMIDTHNVIAQKVDRRIYNTPSCDEVAALVVGDFDSSDHGRDIIVRSTYPLLFPYGEDGYQLNIPYRGQQEGYVPGRRTRVSLREFICFRLQIREQEDGIIHKCRQLFQQFVVDCFTMIESQRLYEIRMKQSTIKGEVLQGMEEAMRRGDDEASSIWTRVILPSSFTGGRRYMFNCCQDAMRFTEREQISIADRLDISCRVFHAKLKCLLSDLKEGVFFGPLSAVKINDIDIDNRFVVSYNPLLLMKYQAHINLEFYNKSNVIKYLFKYINKGPDRVIATVGETYYVGESSHVVDEIKQYYNCRYLSPSESMWRIFAYDIHHRWPSVQRLTFHLPNQQHVVFDDADITTHVYLHNKDLLTMFRGWMMANRRFPDGRSLTYVEYPGKFVYCSNSREWKPRQRGFSIGRLSFEACSAIEFLIDDKEYVSAIKEVAEVASAAQLKGLFVMLLLSGSMRRPLSVWEQTWAYLSDDILYRRRHELQYPNLTMSQYELQIFCLLEIEKLL